jgi:RNA polymerase sigma-70 factor (ECF subfamily)
MNDPYIHERELIDRIKGGDREAYMELISPFRLRLYKKAIQLIGDPMDAEDVLQEALVTAFLALASFRGESSIYTWLYRILVNKCRDYLRSSRSKGRQIDLIDPFTIQIEDKNAVVEKNHELEERSSYLKEKIVSMNAKYRNILMLRYYDDLSYQEIAELLGVSLGTVKSRLFKARELLRRKISNDGKEGQYLGG